MATAITTLRCCHSLYSHAAVHWRGFYAFMQNRAYYVGVNAWLTKK